MKRATGSICVAVACSACIASADPAPLPAPEAFPAFVAQAQPVLESRCASPSCHGTAERPLSVFAVHRHRMSPDDAFVDEPLSGAELRHNFSQAWVFVAGAPDAARSLLVAKPLSVDAGGSGHSAVEVFLQADEYDYQRLRGWAARALASAEDR